MNWLNLRTSWIREPEFIGCEPTARATWFCVLAHCCELENGGRLKGARAWKDRQWQQTCGVTLSEVDSAAPLLTWDGDDLIAWRYPTEKEQEVKHLRLAGGKKTQRKTLAARANGALGGRPKSPYNPTLNQTETQQEPNKKPIEGEGEGELERECTLLQPISETQAAENGNPRVYGTPIEMLSESDQIPELLSKAEARAAALNQRIPHDFADYVFDDWHNRGGKDAMGIEVRWTPHVTKRWRREQTQWEAKLHNGNKVSENGAKPDPLAGYKIKT